MLPDDWNIVYKIAPITFDKSYIYQFSTFPDWFTSEFYYDLLKTNRVIFVYADTPSKDLIINSMGVASINGSVSVEAIVLGKHAIIFSPMWYDKLDGIHLCETQANLNHAINCMKNRDLPKPRILNFHFSDS